ncbi:pol-like protein [Hirsutella rhossiliensis]|uniref:Pol-like protein n=1 Tax=Hirsutella rhossiliensis TaxID=111463 RepID=A0A9P8N073_9HYPO|nr:pol-like protein [Hirsutella rhossiliensis]KAH0964207.1 pol-like protein [Hirsutella rhossiliensis]
MIEKLGRAQSQNAEGLPSPPVARVLGGSRPNFDTPFSKACSIGTRKPLPNPPKYDGSRKSYALELDVHYHSENCELWYLVNSCLDERPQQVIATFYAAGGPGSTCDPQEFMRYLDRTSQDSNIQSRAAASLRTMSQRDDQSLASFLRRFEQALAEAGGADSSDNAKIVFLETAINTRLQHSLVTSILLEDYQGWLARVQEIAGRLERLKSVKLPARHPISLAVEEQPSGHGAHSMWLHIAKRIKVEKAETKQSTDTTLPRASTRLARHL